METKVGDYSAAYDVMKEAKILKEHRVNLEDFVPYGFDFTEGIKAMGWKDYFFSSSSATVCTPAVKELWCNISVNNDVIEGFVREHKLVVSIKDIVEVTGCPSEGISFYDGWKENQLA